MLNESSIVEKHGVACLASRSDRSTLGERTNSMEGDLVDCALLFKLKYA